MSKTKKTFSQISTATIFPPDMVVPTAWKINGWKAPNMKLFNETWFYFKKEYRNRYVYKYAERNGFALTNEVHEKKIDDSVLLSQVQSLDSSATAVVSSFTGTKNSQYHGGQWLFQKYGTDYNTSANTVTIGTKVYIVEIYMDIIGHVITIDLKLNVLDRNPITHNISVTNDEYLYALYSTPNGNRYFATLLSSSPAYSTGGTIEMVPIVPLKENGKLTIPEDDATGKAKVVKKFLRKLGLDGEELAEKLVERTDDGKHEKIHSAYIGMGIEPRDPYILPADLLDRWTKIEDVQNFPIPILNSRHNQKKEITHADGTTEVSHYYINSGPETLRGSAAWWARKKRRQRRTAARLLYETVNVYGNGIHVTETNTMSSTITIEKDVKILPGIIPNEKYISRNGKILGNQTQVSQKDYAWFKKEQGIFGIINNFNGCRHAHDEMAIEGIKDGGTLPVTCTGIIIQYQLPNNTYAEMFLSQVSQVIKISGETTRMNMDGSWKSSTDDDDSDSGGAGEKYPRIFVPIDTWEKANFAEAVFLKEYGMHFLMFTKIVVKVKWWKAIIGAIIGIIVGIIICVASGGTGCTGGAFVGGLIFNAIVGLVIYYVAAELLKNIDNPWVKAILQIVVQLVKMYFLNDFSFDGITNEVWLTTAVSVTTMLVSTHLQIKMQELQKKIADDKARTAAGENIENRIDQYGNNGSIMSSDMSVHYSNNEVMNPTNMMTAQLEGMYNFDQFWDVTGTIELRSQVRSG